MKVNTHTFKLGKYYIEEDRDIEGLCDLPDEYQKLRMLIMSGDDQKALASAIHESMHAEGIPTKYLDDGYDPSVNIARFLYRLGWRRTGGKK